jgi:AraC-like DNA-binding protein
MDVLSDILQSVRLRSQVYGRMEMTAPWGMKIDLGGSPHPGFIVVSRGTCSLDVEGVPGPITLAGGDFVLLPRGRPHVLRDRPETPAVPFENVLAEMGRSKSECTGSPPLLRYGGGGASTSLVCGCFSFEAGGETPLIESLPPLIHVKGDEGAPMRWLEAMLQFIAAEAASPMPGAETIRSRLADILFVQAIRVHIASEGDRPSGWLRALTDPQIGAALRMIHERTDAPWTVDSLADRVEMSRSSFAERFRGLVGVPPLGYLTRWRIHKGASLLVQGDATVATIAHAVGYETEGSFGKVFKRYKGTSPGEYRASWRRREVAEIQG